MPDGILYFSIKYGRVYLKHTWNIFEVCFKCTFEAYFQYFWSITILHFCMEDGGKNSYKTNYAKVGLFHWYCTGDLFFRKRGYGRNWGGSLKDGGINTPCKLWISSFILDSEMLYHQSPCYWLEFLLTSLIIDIAYSWSLHWLHDKWWTIKYVYPIENVLAYPSYIYQHTTSICCAANVNYWLVLQN